MLPALGHPRWLRVTQHPRRVVGSDRRGKLRMRRLLIVSLLAGVALCAVTGVSEAGFNISPTITLVPRSFYVLQAS